MASRNQYFIDLGEELSEALKLVRHSREALSNELESEFAQKKLSIDSKFLGRLKELTASFNSLTDAKVRLDKAQKAIEKELTPAEERDAVIGYLKDMEPWEMSQLCKQARAERDGEPYVYVPKSVQGQVKSDE